MLPMALPGKRPISALWKLAKLRRTTVRDPSASSVELTDVTGAQQQLVADHLGLGGVLAQGGDEEFAPEHGIFSVAQGFGGIAEDAAVDAGLTTEMLVQKACLGLQGFPRFREVE